MHNLLKYCTITFGLATNLAFSQTATAQTPVIQTKGAIIHLADNLNENAKLGWCFDTVGRGFNDVLHAHSCKPTGGDVQFSYDADTGMIQSVAYEGKCMAYSNPDDADTPFGLLDCMKDDPNHQFIYDKDSLEFRISSDQTMCVSVAETIDNAGPYQSRGLLAAPCAILAPEFKQWVIRS